MALEATLGQLCTQLLALRETFVNLRTTVREDKPLQDDVVLVDVFGDAADDLLGLLDEALESAAQGHQAADHPQDLPHVRHALVTAHVCCQQIMRRYWGDLFGYVRLRELRRFGRRRGGEWRAWARSVHNALDACQEPLWAADHELFRCWHELTERIGRQGVSVHAVNIGQRMIVSGGRSIGRDDVAADSVDQRYG